MPKVTEAYREARRDEIAAAALRCFAQKGYRGTSMADIIAESGLSAGAIYGHYAGKRELFRAVTERVLAARRDDLARAEAGGRALSPGETIATLLRGMVSEPFAPSVMIQMWSEAAIDDELREVVDGILALVRDTVREHIAAWVAEDPARGGDDPAGYVDRLTPVAMGLAPGFMIQRALSDGFDEEAYLEMLPEVLPH
ncbi:TetR/AcrR family transcriptional regulator [Agromyces sp. SYSU T00194]|uniref:TetR/AcrR family transcriptional regulator n=1 Tax=Agromyces chitinivorans TaxID=3158560 RepID=UPI003393F375